MASQLPKSLPRQDEIHVLVVDDDRRILKMLADYLGEQQIRVSTAENGAQMWDCLARSTVDIILLDLVLAGEDGLSLAMELRVQTSAGIIILTGRGDVMDRVVGLEIGADDYVAKPFHLREILARIKSVLRRTRAIARPALRPPSVEREVVAFAGWEIHIDQRQLIAPNGQEQPLTTGEFGLLMAFVNHPNRVLNRDLLMDLAKGRQWEALDRSVDTQVARLRKKIEPDPKNPTLIRSVRGVGYLFTAEVTRR